MDLWNLDVYLSIGSVEATPQVPKLCDSQPNRNHEMPRRAKTGIFTPSKINQKPIAAANSMAKTETGSGAIAIPRTAKIEIIRMSATEDATSHTVGRSPQRWRRARRA